LNFRNFGNQDELALNTALLNRTDGLHNWVQAELSILTF